MRPMSPGGHLVTSAAAASATLAATGSLPLTVGVVVGGFLIDVAHAVDYVLVERRRELTTGAILRYYTERRARRMVLALLSYVFCLALWALAWWLDLALLADSHAGDLH